MNKTNQLLDFSQIDEITKGDLKFRKELIEIFMEQIFEFIDNMNKHLSSGNLEQLARESHTAKSSAMIFGMENTGHLLKKIQLLAEEKKSGEIPQFLLQVESNFKKAHNQLNEIIKTL